MTTDSDPILEQTLGELYYLCHPHEFLEPPVHYEEALVKDALYRRATWLQIAISLGLTEQGARHRYRHLLGSPGEPFVPPDC